MSPRASSVLVLDDASVPQVLQSDGRRVVVHRVHGVLQAAVVLASERPPWLVINPARAWHRQFVRLLPEWSRPTIVAVGRPAVDAALVDGWLDPAASPDETWAALDRALRRAAQRRAPGVLSAQAT